MTYRDIVVIMDGSVDARFRAQCAADIAARSGAHLTGLFPRSDFLRTYFMSEGAGYLPAVNFEVMLKEHEEATAARAEAAREAFEEAAANAVVPCDWAVMTADDNNGILGRARRADLVIMPPRLEAALGNHAITAAAIGMGCGGPVLVLPEAAVPPGGRVLVAWKDARESARALHDAWPLILAAGEVHVLTVAPEVEGEADHDLQTYFERHGVQANLIVDRHPRSFAAQVIREQVRALEADLLVMGLYGRPRLQELVLGGISDVMLYDPPCALLVSH